MVSTRQRLDPRGLARLHNVNSAWWHWSVNVLAASPALSRAHRRALLKRCGLRVGTGIVESGCWFFGDNIDFGEWAMINHRCYFDARDRITLGAKVGLAPEVMLVTSGHLPGNATNRRGPFTSGPLRIGDGVWLGTRATVLGGLSIGAGCVVAAGAVVTRDLEPHGLYAGVPARRLKDLPT